MAELMIDDAFKNIRICVNGDIIATQEIIDDVKIYFSCSDGTALGFGSAFSPHCDVVIVSNEIYGDSKLDAIKMGAIFVVECEFESGTYTPLGRFEIGSPVIYTDDYQISFSGEGMIGSVLARTKMNWNLMKNLSDNAKKGILTLNQAVGLIQSMFPTVTIEIPDPSYMPTNYERIKIVVPLSLNKWKKNKNDDSQFKKWFVKLSAREFLSGIALMLGANVIEYGNSIRIVTIAEMWENATSSDDYFSADSYVSDFVTERYPYAPKSLKLTTYDSLPVTTKKNGSKRVHGFCYGDACKCHSIYGYDGSMDGYEYDVNVDCQWIGKSFETFYFNNGNVNGESGEFEDVKPTNHLENTGLQYTACSLDFSGWNDIFCPANFIRVRGFKKNTATQEETPFELLTYIEDMTFMWNGTISVQISSFYNGEASEITVSLGGDADRNAGRAWNNGTNIPEYAEVEEETEGQG